MFGKVVIKGGIKVIHLFDTLVKFLNAYFFSEYCTILEMIKLAILERFCKNSVVTITVFINLVELFLSCLFIYLSVGCVCVCVCVYIHTHTHTHTHFIMKFFPGIFVCKN